MKKFLKIFLITIISILLLLYIAFLLAAPIFNKFFGLEKYKADIQKIVKDFSKLNLSYNNIKIFTTPLLSAGVVIDGINVKFDDNSTLFSSERIKGGIALPSLLTLTVKTSKCDIENPNINLEIVDDKQYKIVSLVENIINENNKKPKQPQTEQNELVDKIIQKIRIKVPSIKITNYEANVSDLKNAHNLKLKGQELILGYNSANNTFKIKTDSKLLSDNNVNINAKLNISSSLPEIQSAKEEVDPEETIAIPFVNPVKIYQTYDFKTDIDSKLKIRNTKQGVVSYGYINIDNLNLKLSDIRLPNSFFHAKMNGKTIEYESNIYAKKDEKIILEGLINYGKQKEIKTAIVSDKIHFANLVDLLEGLLDSLNINNSLNQIKTTGYLIADAKFQTDFKKLKSEGSIVIKDGSFINPKYNIGIKDIIANLILDDNVLNVEDTSLTINNSKLSAQGTIDTKSNADIKLDVNNLSLAELYDAFAPRELKSAFLLSKASLSAHVDIEGKLDSLKAKLNTNLKGLNLSDAKKTMFITNDNLNIAFNAQTDSINGGIVNTGFKLNIPSAKTILEAKKAKVDVNQNAITINPFDMIYNNLSKINVKGNISNYLENPNIDLFADGKISTVNINQTLGKEISAFVPSKGSIPLKVSIKGDSKEQEILAQIFANRDNFISPVNFNSLYNAQSLINCDIKIKGNKIKIKDSGLYKAQNGFTDDLKSNLKGAVQIAELTTILDGGHINLFRLNIPKEEQGQIAIFKKSSFKTKGRLAANGSVDDLKFIGNLKVQNLNIPELFIKTNIVDLDFLFNTLTIKAKEINVNGSKIDGSLKADLKPSKIFKINDINVKSNLIDVDKAMLSANEAMKYVPQTGAKAPSSAKSANIPLAADGRFNIKKLKTGNMIIENIKGNLGIKNNDLIISNLDCKAFRGDVRGNIKMNLLSGLLTIKLNGKNLDANKTLEDAANMKDTISGDLKFKTDISLKGATYQEQVKSLKGNVDFELKDGQYGPFAKLENFFLAENIRENAVFKNTIGAILTPLATIDSTHFEKLNGRISFKNGVARLVSIKSQGDILAILITGNMNLLSNRIDSKVRVRLASAVSDMLGPISAINPINIVKNTPGLNLASAKLFSVFSQTVTEAEYKEIPDFAKNHSDNNATKFQIVLRGDVAKPLSLVKSFKWLALQEDMKKAQEFQAKYIKEQEQLLKQELMNKLQSEYEQNNKLKVGVEKVLKMDTTAPEVKKILVEEIIKTKQQTTQSAASELQKKNDALKKELEAKVQNKIEAKKQEREQKLLDAQNKLKSKLQEKLQLQDVVNSLPSKTGEN